MAASDYVSLATPLRLVDTRPGFDTIDGQQAGIGMQAAGSTLVVDVAGRAGIPTDTTVVVLNITAVEPLDDGFLTAHATGTPRPNASSVNYRRHQTTNNTVIARLGTDGTVSTYTRAATHLVVDISGHLPATSYTPLPTPQRLVDTRPGFTTIDGQQAGIGMQTARSTLVVDVAGRAGIPIDAPVVVLNLTAVNPLDPGYLTAHATGTPRPNAASANYRRQQTTNNTVIARLGTDGTVSIYTRAATHLVVDISGHLPATSYTPLPTPQRLVDTRPGFTTIDGQQAGTGGVLGGHSLQIDVAGRAGVPAGASAVVLNVTAVDPLGPGFLTAHATGTPRPNASSANYRQLHTTNNTVIARLGAGGDLCIFTRAATHLVVDISGHLTGPPPPPTGPACPEPRNPVWGPPIQGSTPEPDPESEFGGLSFLNSVAASTSGVVSIQATGRDAPRAATKVWFSPDALTWAPVQVIEGVRLYGVVPAGPGFVAVGREDTDDPGPGTSAGPLPWPIPAVWTSADGQTWTAAPSIDNASFPYAEMDAVAESATGLVAVGEAWDANEQGRPAVWTSSDGLSWTLQAGDPLGTIDENVKMSVAAGPGGVVAVGLTLPEHGTGSVVAWWSPNGSQWVRAPGIASFAGDGWPRQVEAFGSGFVMVGQLWSDSTAPVAWYSADGRSWNDPASLPVRPETDYSSVSGLATDGSILVAVGSDTEFGPGAAPATNGASIWMSSDAGQWVQVPPAALHGAAILDNFAAESVIRIGDTWRVLGVSWDSTPELRSVVIVWPEQ